MTWRTARGQGPKYTPVSFLRRGHARKPLIADREAAKGRRLSAKEIAEVAASMGLPVTPKRPAH
jgi:hypothetical protein